MATVLAYTSPAVGHLFPMTALLLELRSRGHDVHLRTLASWVERMRALGFDAEPIDPQVESLPIRDYLARGPKQALAAAAEVFAARGRFDGPDLARAVEQVRPDVAVVDVNSWGAGFAAEAWGGPWVSFSPYTPALTSRGTPPFGPGLAPLGGPVGAVRDALLRKAVMGAVERIIKPRVNALRAELGLAPVASADEFQRKAPLMLVTTAKPFEYAVTDWGPDVVMTGQLSWEPQQDAPAWLDEIDRPVVLVTTSSELQDDGLLVRTALEALRDEPVHVVATMPSGLVTGLDVPHNATVAEFLPHGPVLERAVVAVTHGGMGATQKALARGIPVVAVPFGRDQLEVARRVEVSRSGVRRPRKRHTPGSLRAAVAEARRRTEGAARVAAGYAAAGGAAAGADAIESRLLDRQPSGNGS
jgi:MGT family glycosyltransferase